MVKSLKVQSFMDNNELSRKIEEYKTLAAQDKSVNPAQLLLQDLRNARASYIPGGEKALAYFISFAFPPFGLIFALRFFKSGKADAKRAAAMCVAITIFVIVAFMTFINIFLNTAGVSLEQIENINVEEFRQTLE